MNISSGAALMPFFLILGCSAEPEPGSDAHIRRVTEAVDDGRLA